MPETEKGPPPLGEPNYSQRLCSRVVGGTVGGDDEQLCNAEASEHIIYWWGESDWDHGFACADHWADYQRRWSCAGHHAVNAACGMPGSRCSPNQPCHFDGLPVEEPVRTVAVALEAVGS